MDNKDEFMTCFETSDKDKALSVALEALLSALPFIEDVLDNKESLACFKKGYVQKKVKKVRNAIAQIEALIGEK